MVTIGLPAIQVSAVTNNEAARRKGTPGLELFIAQHGDTVLAEQARAELKRLSR
ncbi:MULTISPECIES: hypothetical protein [unclassified Bradyrhizobium]|uniref:hypothetical protein n=1 Tax=unclassified Bradyrhizobium TaxID=2631580 RepID=UPI001FF7709E|nr:MULTISPECIES: hypothetical protein [unclassified Bradyrhizobium]MCK1305770.1 hypothetical protein [Bradyrhizobium sp. 45]MCK1466644.1 hypothetical protein [Bradyrhizobium sp. CW10]MCK1499203.1 hypothetical protein [Bradyrhizobium sp. 188]